MQEKTSSKTVTQLLQKEFRRLSRRENQIRGLSAFPDGFSLLLWKARVTGVAGTAYEGLKYQLSIHFTDKYPYEAPKVKFVTKCYHPNVDEDGSICLDILKEKWSAVYNISTILLSIQALLGDPNPASPLNPGAAELWNSNRVSYAAMVKKYHATK